MHLLAMMVVINMMSELKKLGVSCLLIPLIDIFLEWVSKKDITTLNNSING